MKRFHADVCAVQPALRLVLVRNGVVSNEEVLAEVKVVRLEMEAKRAM